MTEQGKKAADKMRRLCSRREYCVSDIRKKLLADKDLGESDVHEIIDLLLEEKYIDDLRYASAYARDKASISGWGEVKIKYMLSAKGISRDVIAAALSEIDEKKAETRLEKLIENKYKSLKEDPQWRLKLIRFALGRGYDYEETTSAIDKLKNGEGI